MTATLKEQEKIIKDLQTELLSVCELTAVLFKYATVPANPVARRVAQRLAETIARVKEGYE